MEALIPWLGFVGAWLLFAGPVHQAAVELHEEGFDEAEHRSLEARAARVAPPERVSAWWWLLPPVAYLLSVRRSRAWRAQLFGSLTVDERQRFISFQNKAAGWLVVAAGALLIALKETAEVIEHEAWPGWSFAPLIIVPFALGLGFTVSRMRRTQAMERELDAVRQPGAEPVEEP